MVLEGWVGDVVDVDDPEEWVLATFENDDVEERSDVEDDDGAGAVAKVDGEGCIWC